MAIDADPAIIIPPEAIVASKPYIIALEEHYHDADIVAAMGGQMEGRKSEALRARLDDLGALRL